jgi:heat-inducible transcriptional repressor
MALKPRQEQVLRAVVEEFIASGSPVGSKHLSECFDFGAAPSTIRGDLAYLEEGGFLDHPHTSAGRVPTDAGYRHYVETIIVERRESHAALPLRLQQVRAEIDEALEATAEALSQVTELMAIVSSPSLASTTIKHVEILPLQADVVMVVIITTSGTVGKRVFRFSARVDEGLVEFARVYLNERLTGFQLGTRAIENAFSSPELAITERAFMAALKPAFEVVVGRDPATLHMGGTSRLLERLSGQGVEHLNDIVAQLEERYNLLELLSGALRGDDIYLRIGHEMGEPSLRGCALVAANYGIANRNLGTVSVLGPTRMDYQRTIAAVREAAGSLSSFMDEVW